MFTRGVTKGLQRLVSIDEVLIPGLGCVVTSCLAWAGYTSYTTQYSRILTGFTLVLKIVRALPHYE